MNLRGTRSPAACVAHAKDECPEIVLLDRELEQPVPELTEVHPGEEHQEQEGHLPAGARYQTTMLMAGSPQVGGGALPRERPPKTARAKIQENAA